MQLKNISSHIIPSTLLKMKPIYTFLCAVLLTIASQATGQNMSTSITSVTQPPYPVGSQVVINLNASNFTKVSSVLLPVTYNSAVLRFDSITNPALPEYTDLTPPFHPNPGVLKIAWFPSLINYPDGVTIMGPNARLMTINFTVIGNGNSAINLSTTVPFTPIEVVNSTGSVIFNNTIFNSSGSGSSGVSITGGVAPPPVGFKIIGTDVYAKQGNRVCVPVTVNDFDNIQLLQYAMHWDNTKLTYDCVRGTAAPIVPVFNPPAAAPGTLLLQWEDPNLLSGLGVTRADFTRIYEVCFNTIGAPGTQSAITFNGFGFGFPPDFTNQFAEAANAMGQNVWTNANHPNGASGIGSTVYIMADPPGGVPVTYTLDKDTIGPNLQTCVDLKVKNFSLITESEFLMTYDATKLSLITPFTIPVTTLGIIPGNITNSVTGITGTIKFKWAKAAGATVADNTTIFSMCFTAIGQPGVVNINFGTSACPNPTPYSTHKKDVGGQPYQFNNGLVNIASSTGPPMLTPTGTNCNTGATGTINVAPGGNASAYIWSNGATTQNLSNIAAGTYTVTVTYGAAGTASSTAIVTSPAVISMSQAATGVNCFGQSNGSIVLTPAGGTAPYTYAWMGPNSFTAATKDLTGIVSGNYVVTITDSKQCTFASPAVNVPSPQALALPNNNVTVITPTCFNSTNAGINITPTGGTAPYTYDWSNDGPEDPDNDPQNIVGLGAGTFTVTVTDSKGCIFTPPAFIVTQPQPVVTTFIKKDNAKCFGTATGIIEITAATGGSGNKTYVWKTVPGGQQVSVLQNPVNLAPGMYNVTVTDGNGCTTTLPAPVTIENAPGALMVSNTTTPGLCFGQATGSITQTIVGGWPGNPGFQWTGGLPPVKDHPAVSSGAYTVTVTDFGGCSMTQTVTVGGAQSAITIGNPVVSNVSCFGSGNGGICINPTGGNGGPYSVSWSTLAGLCIGTLAPGTYTPIVTDAQQCTAVFPAITVAGPPSPIALDTNIIVANPTGGIDLMVSGGTGTNYSYLWSTGATTQDLLNVAAGTYTVTVTDANSCTATGVYAIPTGNVLTGNVTVSSIQNSCGENGCINLNITAAASSGSPYTLTWNGGGSLPASSNPTPAICGLQVGLYTVTITASNGNTTTVTAVINQLQPASYSSNSSNPQGSLQNGSITITPSFSNANYTYTWNNGATTAILSPLDSGVYIVTITNVSSGCTAVPPPFNLVRQYQVLAVSIAGATNPTCANSTNGSIVLNVSGGVPNLSYKWSGPNGFTAITKDIFNLAPGSYAHTITQGNGVQTPYSPIDLSATSTLAISNVNELSLAPGGTTQVSGATVCDGVAQVVFAGASGAASILWSNGVITATNATLCGGIYGVTVTDAAGCSSVWSDALTVPAAIAATNTTVTPKCFGESNGSARVKVSGGVEPYEVEWSNGQYDQVVFSNSFSQAISLASGTYTVTVTDKNLVSYTTTVTVPAATQIEITFTGIDPISFNDCDGERIAFVTGATAPILYTWEARRSGLTGETERAENLCAGDTLVYYITDANGCAATIIEPIPYPEDGCFQVRPVLTPAEQDGNNDYTLITCIETAKHTVEIYNRWGQLVFQTDTYNNNLGDPSNTWTGFTRSGQSLPEGVYFYVLTVIDDKNLQHQFKGHINLLK